MIVKNLKTGKDVTSLFLKYMEGKITKEDFEKKSGLEAKNMNIKIDKK